MPRVEPQWRQLMGVEEGAFSAHSKRIPKPSQTLQIISNLGRIDEICMAVLNVSKKRSSNKGAKRNIMADGFRLGHSRQPALHRNQTCLLS